MKHIENHFNEKVRFVRLNSEIALSETSENFVSKKGIKLERTALDTPT